ncbi:hypothetical protein CTRC69_04720 [Chlamydia trachomatis RC-F/69]|nr:hypothetical protein E150_04700 [Chlamydia trachomatis E/150]ADH18608.1 hypothetical protein G9768_04660 [Chlamydia trachomatis G/9768]ADH19535.1 hypothetical protein G11222_04690 [Chlamydia trachomatis G/11222]ADH20454.1 hypothetical protein G11074_04655 [Chlamydia trachomatis G/11074]ADH21380.1 hypothetical protein E11023_04660 [Chlamydia trachomatis E/11023]ADH97552.1 polymorphic outer membrane protein [Chlamydia trachomatis G/9301]AEJ77093.1 hypothetical protein CTL2C_172 [Chlamydia tr
MIRSHGIPPKSLKEEVMSKKSNNLQTFSSRALFHVFQDEELRKIFGL